MSGARPLADVTRGNFTDIADIVRTVGEAGIIVFPGLVDASTLGPLNEEFDRIIEQRGQLGFTVDETKYMVNVRVPRLQIGGRFPATAKFFEQAFMADVARTYMGAQQGTLNDLIFVNQNRETPGELSKPPFALHFDQLRVLKFFVYLTDTDADNGAMWVAPGSIAANSAKRNRALASGTQARNLDNIVPQQEMPSHPIVGPAGTLFVFDTGVSHMAGPVATGRERRIMRGHTYFKAG